MASADMIPPVKWFWRIISLPIAIPIMLMCGLGWLISTTLGKVFEAWDVVGGQYE